ncbi:MAG: hypothetical protein U0641_09560 [Anaerolineae bacterium]|mgnify:CR=1 FL=1
MKTRILIGVTLALLLLIVTGVVVLASTGTGSFHTEQVKSLTPGINEATLPPGNSQWYSFDVSQPMTPKQAKEVSREGLPYLLFTIRLDSDTAWNQDMAHNTGFRIYSPSDMLLIENNRQLRHQHTEGGNRIEPPLFWGYGSPLLDSPIQKDLVDQGKIDAYVSSPKVWQGVFPEAGTYYVEVFNEGSMPMTYQLQMSSDVHVDAP